MIALIAHTEPDANIPSKNHEIQGVTPKIWLTGEKNTIPKKNPTHVEQHIMQDNMSIKNFHWLCIKLPSSKDFSRMKFLGPLKIDP
jgi:hypothetical protein